MQFKSSLHLNNDDEFESQHSPSKDPGFVTQVDVGASQQPLDAQQVHQMGFITQSNTAS